MNFDKMSVGELFNQMFKEHCDNGSYNEKIEQELLTRYKVSDKALRLACGLISDKIDCDDCPSTKCLPSPCIEQIVRHFKERASLCTLMK